MFESSPQESGPVAEPLPPQTTLESIEQQSHLDATTLMKEKNCYFVHMMQVTKALDVSENNKSVDTNKLTNADKLDILYAAQPTLSTSTLRPHTQDGTFQGGFGVIFSQGKIVSASRGDNGTIAISLSERRIGGGNQNSKEEIDKAIDRPHGGYGKSYNEIVLKEPEVAGGFMKIDGESLQKRIRFEEEVREYGHGQRDVVEKVGTLDLSNEKNGSIFDTPFSVLLEMEKRGPVFFMNENNEMLQVTHIDEKTRKVRFSTRPITPSDIAEVYGEHKINKYTKQEMLDRVSGNGITLS